MTGIRSRRTQLRRLAQCGDSELIAGVVRAVNMAIMVHGNHEYVCGFGIVTVTRSGPVPEAGETGGMKPPPDPHYRHRFPAKIISHAIWLYHVFSLSLRDVELLLAERGIIVSYETVRRWCKKFGASFADSLRRRRPRPRDKWHMDEVFIRIQGVQHYLWRAVDQEGVVLDISCRPARCQRREALLQAAAEGSAIRPASDRDRQAAELWRRSASTTSRRRAPTKPISEQSGRELASADAPTRAADATVQIVRTSARLPLRSFLHLRPLPSKSTPTCSPCLSRDPVRTLSKSDSRRYAPYAQHDRRGWTTFGSMLPRRDLTSR